MGEEGPGWGREGTRGGGEGAGWGGRLCEGQGELEWLGEGAG